jgi:hypothetical protein
MGNTYQIVQLTNSITNATYWRVDQSTDGGVTWTPGVAGPFKTLAGAKIVCTQLRNQNVDAAWTTTVVNF